MLHFHDEVRHHTSEAPETMFAIMRVCRQIYGEAKIAPYHSGTLVFRSAFTFFDFTVRLDPQIISLICNVTICLHTGFEHYPWSVKQDKTTAARNHQQYWKMLYLLPNLEYLQIDADSHLLNNLEEYPFRHQIISAIHMLRGLSGLKIKYCSDETREEAWFREGAVQNAKRLEDNWRLLVTRPKSSGLQSQPANHRHQCGLPPQLRRFS